MREYLSRRRFLQGAALAGTGVLVAACAPKIVKETVVVEKEVEKVVKETVIVAGTPKVVEKEVTRIVEKEVKPAAKEEIVLRLNMRAGGEKGEKPIYVDRPAEFMEEYPYIKVELVPIPGGEYYTKIQTMAAAGTLGDVVFAQDDACQQRRHVVNGLLQVSDDWLEANGHSKSEWFPSVINALTYEGKMYGLPKSASPSQAFLFYNQEMFEAEQIPFPPKHGCTHEELVEWIDKVTKGEESGRDVFGFSPSVSGILAIHNWVRSFGSFALNEEGTEVLADGPEWYEAMRYVNAFYTRKQVPSAENLPSGGLRALFAAGKLAIIHGGRWEWKGMQQAVAALEKPFKWDVIEMPRVANAKGWRASVNTHDPSTQTKHVHEAFLLAYALADKRMGELVTQGIGYCTARIDDADAIAAMSDADPTKAWLQLQHECQLNTENFRGPKNLRGLELQTTTNNFLDQLWLGQEELTPDFMKRFKAACQEILDKPL